MKACKMNYDQAVQERLDLFSRHRAVGIQAPLEDRCDALYKLYQAKMAYAKQYHGKKFEELFQDTQRLAYQQYLYDVEYTNEPTDENMERLKNASSEYNTAMALFETFLQK
jgi:hypothetical protein